MNKEKTAVKKEFEHFCSCIDFGPTLLTNRAIVFMNEFDKFDKEQAKVIFKDLREIWLSTKADTREQDFIRVFEGRFDKKEKEWCSK